MADDLLSPVITPDGRIISIEDLDKTYDRWVHTGREITVRKCAPDSAVAVHYLRNPNVYRLTRHIRGRALLISNTGYQALKLLKNLFEQIQFRIGIYTERNTDEVWSLIKKEAQKSDNEFADSFTVIIYGAPDDFDLLSLPEVLNDTNAPLLRGKPKLLYVIGNDTIVQQVYEVASRNRDPDYLLASTGFNGVMFYIYALCSFVHELSAKDIWKIMSQFANYHRFSATSHCTLTKEFYFFPGLTISLMPEEIKNMDPGDVELYLQMLETSRMSTYNVRLMFVGLYGAGKTSLARRIMGRDIADVTSTDGIDVYIGKCKVDLNNQTWTTLEDTQTNMPYTKLSRLFITDEESESRIPNIRHLEYPSEEMETESQSPSNATEHTENLTDSYQPDEGFVHVTTTHKRFRAEHDAGPFSPSAQESMELENMPSPSSVMPTTSDTTTDFEIINILSNQYMITAKRVIEESYKKGPRPKEAFVSLWDFAGQFVYYATHQLFFSPRSIYILTLNMQEDLEKTLKEDWFIDLHGVEEIETQGGVMFWLRSIYTYSRIAQPGVPPIILVGTHKDQLPGDDQSREAQARKYFHKIKTMFQGSPLEYHISRDAFLVDNTREDTEVNRLKEFIIKTAQTMPYWGEQVPAKWVELEQALEDMRLERKAFIKRRELKEIDKSLAKPIGEEEQLTLFLKTHHELGTLIYFDTPQLKDIIVLDPQWIIHAFRYLISAKDFGSKYGELRAKWTKFIDSGHLDVELAKAIWERDTKHDFYANHETILHFLEKLDIIVKGSVTSQDGKRESLPFFFVPCLVKESPRPEILKPPPDIPHARSTPVLCLAFEEKFLPPAVFNRVVTVFLSRWPIARQGSKTLLFCGCAVFEVKHEKKGQDRHRMTIFFRQAHIGVRITRFTTSSDKTVDSQICNIVRRVLVSAVRQELTRFRKVNKNDDTLFSYKLQCKDTNEYEQLQEGLLDLNDLEETIDTDFFCEAHSDMTHPHLVSSIEMLRDWFPEKIPPDAKVEAVSFQDIWLQRLSVDIKNHPVDDRFLSRITRGIGSNWQFICVELGVKQIDLDKVQENWPHLVDMQIYNSLRLWKDNEVKQGRQPTIRQLLNVFIMRSNDVTLDWETIQNVTEGIE